MASRSQDESVEIPAGGVVLEGDLQLSGNSLGVVLFAHGSGSGRHSPRNRFVARGLRESRLSTLLVDLLTLEEEQVDMVTRHLRFDIGLLGERLVAIVDWLREQGRTRDVPVGLFGASTGAGAALVAASRRKQDVKAVVSRGGRPDLAGEALPAVEASTLLIVGGADEAVLELNRQAMEAMRSQTRLEVVPGAGHLFEESGKLEQVIDLSRGWFQEHLRGVV